MPKEESGRLFSKVAKFVRNPLKDWSELDAPSSTTSDSSLPEQTYSREMLKEMIERRQRNDFVRRREFDMLRKLRQREAAAHAFEGTVTPSSFNINSSSEKSEGRALTLKKIDEIEEQMSQQWWKGRGPNGETLVNPPPDAGAETLPPVHVDDLLEPPPVHRTVAAMPPVQAASPVAAGGGGASPLSSRLAHDGALEEAVIRFAHGDDAGAEAILLQALASESAPAADGENDAAAERDDSRWRTLFDLYRATGDAAKFAAARMRYAQRMKRMGPDWVSLEDLARSVKAVTASEEAAEQGEGGGAQADWSSPARLSREGLMSLTRALSQAGSVWTLDWRPLTAIEPEAAAPLRVLLTHWADSPVKLRFIGTAQLLAVLAEAAPNNERGTDDVWWQLHLAALRVMHLPDDFELVALNYCITYEVSPPSWQDPIGECTALAAPPPSRSSSVWSLLSSAESESFPTHDTGFAALAGDLRGESLSAWQRLDTDLRHTTAPVISCAALLRMDLAAAGTLLSWVRARDADGERVQFVDAHRLIAALFGLVGITDHATVAVRKN
ncbi:ABC-type transporter Mla MlaB component [Variovorax boronicumulans]|jgi:ABC-type transporter Mla MlaB component|uniref:STAS domain-containing protein n=1 Tax=Variovorax boronicumulans TaxID=436515 RepID=UPI00277E3F67|nr:STAS domain-containing protein [Variovorax boronicumulans]MDQ0070035.1 ABC-type transporter Mla MlaB component [Variovorax boronicumulans]